MFRFVALSGFLTAIIIAAIGLFPQTAAAKCPDITEQPDIVCSDMQLKLYPNPPVPGQEAIAIAIWTDQRTETPVTNSEWLSQRGSPVYLWMWDHEPSPDERSAHAVLAGMSPPPQIWVVLHWDGIRYNGGLTLPEPGRWYYRITTSAPVIGLESDSGVGYSGPVYPLDVPSGAPRFWVWLLIVPGFTATAGVGLWVVLRSKVRWPTRNVAVMKS